MDRMIKNIQSLLSKLFQLISIFGDWWLFLQDWAMLASFLLCMLCFLPLALCNFYHEVQNPIIWKDQEIGLLSLLFINYKVKLQFLPNISKNIFSQTINDFPLSRFLYWLLHEVLNYYPIFLSQLYGLLKEFRR